MGWTEGTDVRLLPAALFKAHQWVVASFYSGGERHPPAIYRRQLASFAIRASTMQAIINDPFLSSCYCLLSSCFVVSKSSNFNRFGLISISLARARGRDRPDGRSTKGAACFRLLTGLRDSGQINCLPWSVVADD
jgi:hypothetical protein